MAIVFKPRVNPIVVRELRSRMRGPRAFAVLTAFLVLLSGFAYGLYAISTATQSFGAAPLGASIGRSMFIGMAFFILALVCLIAPALTAGAISSEQERRTLEMLLATPLRPASVLLGKLFSALIYVLLLVAAAIPITSIIFVFGGVTVSDMLRALAVLLASAILFGAAGVFFSTALRRTGRAMVASFALLGLLAFGTYFAYILAAVARGAQPERGLLLLNPIAAMASAAGGEPGSGTATSAFGAFSSLLLGLSGMGAPIIMGGATQAAQIRPLWHYTAGLYLAGAALFLALAVRMLVPVRPRRLTRMVLARNALVGALLLGGMYLLYGPPSYAALGQPGLGAPPPPSTGRDVVGMGMARAVAVPIAVPPPPGVAPSGDGTTGPAQNLPMLDNASLPPAAGFDELPALYTAVLGDLIGQAKDRPSTVYVYDVAGVESLALGGDSEVTPVRIPPQVLESLAAWSEKMLRSSLSILPWEGASGGPPAEHLASGSIAVALGVPREANDGSIVVSSGVWLSESRSEVRDMSLNRAAGSGWGVARSEKRK